MFGNRTPQYTQVPIKVQTIRKGKRTHTIHKLIATPLLVSMCEKANELNLRQWIRNYLGHTHTHTQSPETDK